MARRGRIPKRTVMPDPIYGSELAHRFINRMMYGGKKSVAERIFYRAMDNVEERTGKSAGEVFEHAIRNVMPTLEVRPRRVGGQTYQVPMEVPQHRKRSLAFRWLIAAARRRAGRTMIEKLTAEVLDAANNTGAAIKKREDTHRMADANKAFAHYRW